MSKSVFLCGLLFVGFSSLLTGQATWGGFYFHFEIANDVLYLPIKTDQYFTSGLNLEIGSRRRRAAPLRPGGSLTTESYWRLTHNIYTPQEIDADQFLKDDRPFASYLVATRGKSFTDDQLGGSVRWELTAGVLGKYAAGGRIQNAWHSVLSYADEVPGWPNEVKPDLILNYQLGARQRFEVTPRFDFTAGLTGRVGTLYNNLAGELNFSLVALRVNERKYLRFDLISSGRLVAYDATLSGGLINRDDRYRGRVKPNVLVGMAGLDGTIIFNRLRLSGGLRHLTTEFRGGRPHAWAWFSVGMQPGVQGRRGPRW